MNCQCRKQLEGLRIYGPRAVLVKGGHLEGKAIDLLFHQGKFQRFIALRETAAQMHGTGCTHSAAITAELAHGKTLEAAVRSAKQFYLSGNY